LCFQRFLLLLDFLISDRQFNILFVLQPISSPEHCHNDTQKHHSAQDNRSDNALTLKTLRLKLAVTVSNGFFAGSSLAVKLRLKLQNITFGFNSCGGIPDSNACLVVLKRFGGLV